CIPSGFPRRAGSSKMISSVTKSWKRKEEIQTLVLVRSRTQLGLFRPRPRLSFSHNDRLPCGARWRGFQTECYRWQVSVRCPTCEGQPMRVESAAAVENEISPAKPTAGIDDVRRVLCTEITYCLGTAIGVWRTDG
ncbi:unnamed protein product, partial [Mycena citricolor]